MRALHDTSATSGSLAAGTEVQPKQSAPKGRVRLNERHHGPHRPAAAREGRGRSAQSLAHQNTMARFVEEAFTAQLERLKAELNGGRELQSRTGGFGRAGYRNSSTRRERRCTSSMNNTSALSRPHNAPTRSRGLLRVGPLVSTMRPPA